MAPGRCPATIPELADRELASYLRWIEERELEAGGFKRTCDAVETQSTRIKPSVTVTLPIVHSPPCIANGSL
jgi:hypothetical protein